MIQIERAKRLNDIGEYYFSQKLREIDLMNRQGQPVINLGIGSPDLPPHEHVIATLCKNAAISDQHAYQSYKGIQIIRDEFSNWYKKHYGVVVNAEKQILPLMGSKEGIMHICMTYINPGDKVLLPDPGYPTYTAAVKLAGGTPVYYDLTEENNWEPDWDALAAQDLKSIKLMWVNYPHMPSGKNASVELFKQLVEFGLKNQILICNDNPYSFILNNHPLSIFCVDEAWLTAIELNSLSKSHNMAGWRIGVLIGAEQLINDVLTFKSNMDSGMFKPLQLAAVEALKLDQQWFDSINSTYGKRRKLAEKIFQLLKCSYENNQTGMFLWAKIPNNYDNAIVLSDELLKNAKVFITPGNIFGKNGSKYLRISLCSNENVFDQAIKRIELCV